MAKRSYEGQGRTFNRAVHDVPEQAQGAGEVTSLRESNVLPKVAEIMIQEGIDPRDPAFQAMVVAARTR